MSYVPTTWIDGETPVNAENLNKLESAVKANDDAIYEINTARTNGEFKGEQGDTGPQGPQGEKGEKGDNGERGYGVGVSVKEYGAIGNGTTDDTAAFQTALTNNRVVFVPGGTYKLSGTLVIRENCCLELSQDTILQFTQTSGNCIEMRGSAVLRGNHAIISVPYEFTGNVISLDTTLDGNSHNSIPPYAKADPMFKRQRFVYDVNIIKPTADGFHRTTDGTCNGTAIYMYSYNDPNSTTDIPWMWAIAMSGVRIAGGFSYGIRAKNVDDPNGYTDNAWNHDMRIEAVIEACEVGVALENCNGAHLRVTVQPCQSVAGTAYAKWGVYLNDSRFVDMIGSRVWDWNADNSLWTPGGEYQHIAMIGNCSGLVLDDFLCYETSADIRDLIYTDMQSNFDKMSVLQEPGNKHFKSVSGVPYFNDGTANRKLMLASEKITAEQVEFITPADGYYTYEPRFTNLAINYTDGVYLLADGTTAANADSPAYTTTDFIPIDGADSHVYRIGGDGITWNDNYGYCRIAWYDSSKDLKGSPMSWNKIGSSQYYPVAVEDDTVVAAFSTNANVVAPKGAAYFRLTAKGSGANLVVTLDEKQEYNAIWHGEPKRLDDSIKVKAENVVGGTPGGGVSSWNDLTDKPFGSEVKETVWLKETTYEFNSDNENAYVFPEGITVTPGATYTVIFNGMEYVLTGYEYEGMAVFGDVNFRDTPFCCLTMDGSTGFLSAEEGTFTFSVTEEKEIVNRLDGKFLPEGVGYSEYAEKVIFPETLIEWNETNEYMPHVEIATPLVIGQEYIVVWDGTVYITKAIDINGDGSSICIGNAGPMDMGFEDTGEPFIALYSEDGTMLIGSVGVAVGETKPGSATVSISGMVEIIHKIDPKYLPETEEETETAIPEIRTTGSTANIILTDATTSETKNGFINPSDGSRDIADSVKEGDIVCVVFKADFDATDTASASVEEVRLCGVCTATSGGMYFVSGYVNGAVVNVTFGGNSYRFTITASRV